MPGRALAHPKCLVWVNEGYGEVPPLSHLPLHFTGGLLHAWCLHPMRIALPCSHSQPGKKLSLVTYSIY